jgi:hypothetical protein
VQKAVDAFLTVALPPAPDGRSAHARLPRDLLHRQAFARQQHDPGAQDVLERTRTVGGDGGQPRLGGFIEEHTDSLSHPPRLAHPC